MKIAYIRWRDASYGNGDEQPIANLAGAVELHECGFLLREDKETVTLSMEHQDGAETTRIWLTIPRVNIAEMKTAEIETAFTRRKSRPAARSR